MSNPRKKRTTKTRVPKQPVATPEGPDMLERLDGILNRNSKAVLIFLLLASVVVYLLMFDVKVSEGGDDSGYIRRAYKLAMEGEFPTFQGPLYPMFLSIPILFTGLNLILLKFFSLLFMVGSIFFLHKAFKDTISDLVLLLSLLLVGTNAYVAFYASSTYSEAMFMFMQALLVFFFFRYFIKGEEADTDTVNIRHFAVVGLLTFLLSQVRFVGLAAVGAMIVFFLINRQWKRAAVAPVGFAAFFLPFTLLKKYVLTDGTSAMGSQLSKLMNVHPYDMSKGKETLSGFFQRFVDNSNLYLGKTFLMESGFRPDGSKVEESLTWLVYILFALALFFALKNRNKAYQFTGLYIGAVAGLTFFILQKFWDQNRMILILYPLMYVFFLGGIYQIFRLRAARLVSFAFLIVGFAIVLPGLARTMIKVDENLPIVTQNMKGDRLYGYSPDWVNYIKMVEYASRNLPEDSYVACRKPGMAFIYSGGKDYKGIFRIPNTDPDTLVTDLKDLGVTHIIRANLRVDPSKNTGRTINTIIRYMSFIEQKYPGTFRQIHKIGESEESYLYEINYPY